MPLVAGGVTVADDGSESGSGLALELYLADLEAFEDQLAATGAPIDEAGMLIFKRANAIRANRRAARIVPYLTANADVRVTAGAIDPSVPTVDRVLTGALE